MISNSAHKIVQDRKSILNKIQKLKNFQLRELLKEDV